MKKIPALLLTLTLTAPFAAFGFAECKPDANITTINGQGLPGRMATLTDEHVMVDTIVDVPQGYRMTITRAVRKAALELVFTYTNGVELPVCLKVL